MFEFAFVMAAASLGVAALLFVVYVVLGVNERRDARALARERRLDRFYQSNNTKGGLQ